MSKIRIDLDSTIVDGQTVTFRSPADCSAIEGLVVYYPDSINSTASKTFQFADAHGNNVGSIDLFAANVLVKVILDTESNRAHVQNADTNAYLEGRFKSLESAIKDVGSDAGAHNSTYRGKNLGSSVTAAQWSAISAGTFDDMFIGDYWVINDVTYRIAAFDYYYGTGDTGSTRSKHHVTLVPDAPMYNHAMHSEEGTNTAYAGSTMRTQGLTSAKKTINAAFGSTHVLNYRYRIVNSQTEGTPTAANWDDCNVEIMSEINVFGRKIHSKSATSIPDTDKGQYPLFMFRPDLISNNEYFWLRDATSATYFSHVSMRGEVVSTNRADSKGVRPSFSIC